MDTTIDSLIKILKRVKNCNIIYEKLQLIASNSVWREGFKYLPKKENENDYQKWREFIYTEILDIIKIIEENNINENKKDYDEK